MALFHTDTLCFAAHLDEACPAQGLALGVLELENVGSYGIGVCFKPSGLFIGFHQVIHDAVQALKIPASLDSILHSQ